MLNPFSEKYSSDRQDKELVARTLAGNKNALEELILRHQAWIYNIALRMVMIPEDAEDVTQEILIKIISRLSSFRGRSAFRTWLYRIVANHVLDMKRRRREEQIFSFEKYGECVDATPDIDLSDPRQASVDMNLIVNETRIECMMAMLLCLDRRRRLAFILGAMLGVNDVIGGRIIGVSRENFRQQLCRARSRIANFMNERCSLINKDNPCRCSNKTTALIESGIIDPGNLMFSLSGVKKVREIAEEATTLIGNVLETRCQELYRETPFYDSPDFIGSMRALFESSEFERMFNLGN